MMSDKDSIHTEDHKGDTVEDRDLEAIALEKKKKKKAKMAAKGVETMFRNAYRAQLDMIALAATKANIMISLNGVIVSILMVTSGFIYTNTPIFLLPALLFLITSAISIYFALSSASPSPAPAHTRVFCCIRDVIKRKANFRDFKEYVRLPEKRFDEKTSNILIFDHSAHLPRDVYLKHMADLVDNPEKTYEKMSDQLYWLGKMADQKFKYLRYSYSVFRLGVIVSTLVFLSLKAILFFYPHEHDGDLVQTPEKVLNISRNANANTSILKFSGIYEPSGVQQLSDGRIIVIEDEPEQPLHILKLDADGKMIENKSLNMLLRIAFSKKLDDLEAITTGPDGYLYATTSHKRNSRGQRKKSRELLIRFKIKGNKIIDAGVLANLYDAIDTSEILGKVDKKGKGGIYNLNIESLSFDKQNKLMIGLRNPQIDGKSIILLLENPVEIFEKNETPKIAATPILLDLQGGGIRAMSYDPKLKGYLLTNETYTSESNNVRHSQVSFWTGDRDHQPVPIKLPSLINMNNVEGIAPVTINNEPRVLLISDNGDHQLNRPANYLLLEYHQLTGD
ncbi:MAG: Pycsar system effector family protein [Thiotrichaceae bacterium]